MSVTELGDWEYHCVGLHRGKSTPPHRSDVDDDDEDWAVARPQDKATKAAVRRIRFMMTVLLAMSLRFFNPGRRTGFR